MGTRKSQTHASSCGPTEPRSLQRTENRGIDETERTTFATHLVAITSALNSIDPSTLDEDERIALDELLETLRRHFA
jgi:hypothetical protein